MSYTPKYTSQTKVAGVTQFTSGDSTSPTTTQILTWIQEIEADVDARALANYTLTDQIVDVPAHVDVPAEGTIAWLESMGYDWYSDVKNRLFIPPFLPIVSITSLYRRTSSDTETVAWEQLTEGPADSSSFLQLKKRTKSNQYLGFALYFYQNPPYVGYQRIKMTYVYGWNLSTTIIGEWCTLKVAIKVLEALMEATTPSGTSDYGFSDVRIGVNDLKRRKSTLLDRIIELEDQFFPPMKRGIAFI